jgi:hypothetical protein
MAGWEIPELDGGLWLGKSLCEVMIKITQMDNDDETSLLSSKNKVGISPFDF